MSMTKRYYHEEICAMTETMEEAEYLAVYGYNEKAVDWFPETKLAHNGYKENNSQTKEFAIIDEDLPF